MTESDRGGDATVSRSRLRVLETCGLIVLISAVGAVIVLGAGAGESAGDWLWIGLFPIVLGVAVLRQPETASRRALFVVALMVGVNVAGRFDARPAQIGSAVIILVAAAAGIAFSVSGAFRKRSAPRTP